MDGRGSELNEGGLSGYAGAEPKIGDVIQCLESGYGRGMFPEGAAYANAFTLVTLVFHTPLTRLA
jgi:hypothetical protein